MMGFKHFGILSIKKYGNYNMDQLIEVLGNKNIINSRVRGVIKENKTLDKKGGFEKIIQFRPDEIQNDFTDNFLDIIYLLLKNYMNELININTTLFNQNFENKTFGFSEKKKKKDALKIFNNLFTELFDTENIDSYNASGNKFHALKKRQVNLIQKLRNETGNWIIANYLLGNKNYFNRELFDTHPLLLEIFEFENKLSILLDLNKKFQLEKDTIFTPKSKAELIYEEYSYDFDSLKQVEFIENQIYNEKKVDRAFIVSLFDFFSNKLKMTTPSGKVFGEIINNHFGFDFYEIGLNGSEGNRHLKRVEGLKKEWESFAN